MPKGKYERKPKLSISDVPTERPRPVVTGGVYTPPPYRMRKDSGGESRSVTLKSGGTLTLHTTTKFMALSVTDRAFVFELIDKLVDYDQKNTTKEPAPTPPPPATPKADGPA
jgi:hypothetical protein